jgi:hypothetical protein
VGKRLNLLKFAVSYIFSQKSPFFPKNNLYLPTAMIFAYTMTANKFAELPAEAFLYMYDTYVRKNIFGLTDSPPPPPPKLST